MPDSIPASGSNQSVVANAQPQQNAAAATPGNPSAVSPQARLDSIKSSLNGADQGLALLNAAIRHLGLSDPSQNGLRADRENLGKSESAKKLSEYQNVRDMLDEKIKDLAPNVGDAARQTAQTKALLADVKNHLGTPQIAVKNLTDDKEKLQKSLNENFVRDDQDSKNLIADLDKRIKSGQDGKAGALDLFSPSQPQNIKDIVANAKNHVELKDASNKGLVADRENLTKAANGGAIDKKDEKYRELVGKLNAKINDTAVSVENPNALSGEQKTQIENARQHAKSDDGSSNGYMADIKNLNALQQSGALKDDKAFNNLWVALKNKAEEANAAAPSISDLAASVSVSKNDRTNNLITAIQKRAGAEGGSRPDDLRTLRYLQENGRVADDPKYKDLYKSVSDNLWGPKGQLTQLNP